MIFYSWGKFLVRLYAVAKVQTWPIPSQRKFFVHSPSCFFLMMGENTGMPAFPAYVRKYEAQNQLLEGRGLVYLEYPERTRNFTRSLFGSLLSVDT